LSSQTPLHETTLSHSRRHSSQTRRIGPRKVSANKPLTWYFKTNLFIIISAPYATSVPLYLKTWPKWLRVLSLAPALTTLTLFYLEPLKKNISKLQKAQNLLAGVVSCSPQSCSPRTLLQQLHWLPIKHRIDFKIANVTFRTLQCSQPAYLRSSLHACHSTRSLRLSNTNLLSAPFVRTSFSSRSFSVAARKMWNSLPLSLRTCTSPDTFRRHRKTHYCQQAFHST